MFTLCACRALVPRFDSLPQDEDSLMAIAGRALRSALQQSLAQAEAASQAARQAAEAARAQRRVALAAAAAAAPGSHQAHSCGAEAEAGAWAGGQGGSAPLPRVGRSSCDAEPGSAKSAQAQEGSSASSASHQACCPAGAFSSPPLGHPQGSPAAAAAGAASATVTILRRHSHRPARTNHGHPGARSPNGSYHKGLLYHSHMTMNSTAISPGGTTAAGLHGHSGGGGAHAAGGASQGQQQGGHSACLGMGLDRTSSSDCSAAGRSSLSSHLRDPTLNDAACGVCWDARSSVCVAGCGHGLCGGCAHTLVAEIRKRPLACPFCRGLVRGFVPLGCADGSVHGLAAAGAQLGAA